MNDTHRATQIVLFGCSLLLRVWGIDGLPIAEWLV